MFHNAVVAAKFRKYKPPWSKHGSTTNTSTRFYPTRSKYGCEQDHESNSTKWECHKEHWHNLIAGSFSTPVAVDIKIGQYHFSGQHRMWNLQPAVHQPEKSYNAKATKKTCTKMHNDKRIAAWSYSIEKTTNNTAHWENNIKGNKVQRLPKMLTMQKWFSELRASHQYHSNLRTDCIPDFRKKKNVHTCVTLAKPISSITQPRGYRQQVNPLSYITLRHQCRKVI